MKLKEQLQEYNDAEVAIQKSLDLLPEGTRNWFINKELHFLLLFHTKKYTAAYLLYLAVTKHKQFKNLTKPRKEQWHIYEAYLHYLLAKECIDKTDLPKLKKFRLSRFLNDLSLASQDKRGQQIPILIITIALLIQQKQYFKVYEQVAAIEKFDTRYLKKDDTYRSSCFIRMLIQLPKGDYQQSTVRRKAQKYLKMMQSVPTKLAGQTHELEILPYPMIWEMMLEDLPIDRPALG